MPFGGPGGPGGPGGRGGFGFMNYHNHPSYYGPTIRPAARGYVAHGSGDLISSVAASWVNIKNRMLEAKYRFGKKVETKDGNVKYKATLKSTFVGIRMLTAGRHHENTFNSRVAAADELFNDKRISKSQCNIRKMKAAKKYYEYLLNINYITENEFDYEMSSYANELGIEYVNDRTQQRSR